MDLSKLRKDEDEHFFLPDWILPGLPTPFEMGLRGIEDAIRDLKRPTRDDDVND